MKIKIILIIFIFLSSKITFANELLVSSNGIKLGDSALKYFSKNLIESKKKFIYKSENIL